MKRYFTAALFLALSVVGAAAQINGRVYDDRNANGVYDRGDRAMAGVRVSDGLNVVSTNRDGMFTLEGHEALKFVFLTTPSDYTIAKHYLPIVAGHSGGYDFALTPFKGRVASDGSHSFIHITDTEISSAKGHDKWIDGLRDYAADQHSAFIVHTGDICYEKGLNAHIEMMNDATMGLPVRYSIGNHDYVKGAYGEELFECKYGPIYYSFDVGRTHYVVTPMVYGDHAPGFKPELLHRWLANDLAAMPDGMSVVIFNHDLQCRDGKFVYGDVDLKKFNLKAWIYGHWHINHVKYFGDVATICSSADKGGIDHSAATFRRVDVDRVGGVTSKLVYPYVDESVVVAHCADNVLSVNAYNTSSPVVGVTTTYNVGGKKKSAKLSAVTDWNWRAQLPAGAVDIEVVALCDNGKSSTAKWQATTTSDSSINVVWSANIGSNVYMSSPLVADGRVYVGMVDESGSGKAGVACLNAADGSKLWVYGTRNSVKNAIAATDGKVFAQDAEGYLYAIDAATGTLCWERKLGVADPLPSVVEGLAVHGERLYAGTGKGLAAYDFDGNVVWQNDDWSQNEGTISTFAFTDSLVLTSSQWQALFANDLTTGKLKWRADRDGIRFRASTPVVNNGVIYLLSQNSLFVIAPQSGEVIVRRELPYNVEVGSRPLFVDEAIVFGTTNAGIQALDTRTLEPKWSVTTDAALIYTAPYYLYPVTNIESSPALTCDGQIIIGTADGVVRVIDPASGKVTDQIKVGAPILTTFAVDGNDCYIADYGGSVYRVTAN